MAQLLMGQLYEVLFGRFVYDLEKQKYNLVFVDLLIFISCV